MSDTDMQLDDCGCCEGVKAETPVGIYNPPGQTTLAYRVGTHSQFAESQHAELSRTPGLQQLKTRSDDDPSVAILDAWANVLDVLAFYQERNANEGFLRTAIERRSLRELADAIGYQLRPGVAASTFLAFTMETLPGSPRELSLKRGAKAQSIPAQGEQAQTFETVEDIRTRPEWNELRPRMSRAPVYSIDGTTLRYGPGSGARTGNEVRHVYLKGGATGLEAGQLLLIVKGAQALSKRVLGVVVEQEIGATGAVVRSRVEIESGVTAGAQPVGMSTAGIELAALVPGAVPITFGESNIEQHVLRMRWREKDLQSFLQVNGWNPDELLQFVARWRDQSPGGAGILALRERIGFFGNNAPIYSSLLTKDGEPLYDPDWDSDGWPIWDSYGKPAVPKLSGALNIASLASPSIANLKIKAQASEIFTLSGHKTWSAVNGATADAYLERNVAGVAAGGWVVFVAPGNPELRVVYRLDATQEVSLTAFGVAGKAMGLKLRGSDGTSPSQVGAFLVRSSTAHVKSEALEIAATPILDAIEIGTTSLELDQFTLGLKPGQLVLLSGEDANARGVMRNEALEIEEIVHNDGVTSLQFHELGANGGTQYAYVRGTVKLNANVARATHGESKFEVLGGGDAAQAFQRLALRQSPLTYVAAPTPRGMASTLEVRVSDVAWEEVHTLYGAGNGARVFAIDHGEEGKCAAQFGDGETGARLPTGTENVTARYRVGSGLGGMVKAEQISLLLTRPAGLKGVTNPIAASGAADAESLDQARHNAPLAVLTLDRVVSLQDFEDYVRAYSGIGKAQAACLWDGEARVIHITIAGADGKPVPAGATLLTSLNASLRAARDPGRPVRIGSFVPLSFNVSAKVLIERRYRPESVRNAVVGELQSAFSFERRAFGQGVTRSEVLAVMQKVPGVVAVDLDFLHLTTRPPALESRLPARTAQWNNGLSAIEGAELLLVDPRRISLSEMSP